jgi:hypothetical protein
VERGSDRGRLGALEQAHRLRLICAAVVSRSASASVFSVASGTEFQIRNESRAATS